MRKTPTMRLWEIEHGHRLEDILLEANEIGFPGVAAKYEIPYVTLMSWKRRLGIQVRRSVVLPGAGK